MNTSTTDMILAADPSVVAVVAIVAAAWQQCRGFRHAREMGDLADARHVFDDAAVALHDASVALSGGGYVGPGVTVGEDRDAVLAPGAAGVQLGVQIEGNSAQVDTSNLALESQIRA